MSTEDARKLFIAGLPDSVSEDVLRQLFEATGATVVEVSIPRDRATGKPRGFAFVTMQTSEQAQAVRDALDNSTQAGRVISVRAFQTEIPKRNEGQRQFASAAPSDRTLYVGNLPFDCTEEKIEEFFSSLGVQGITRIHLPTGQDGRKRGFGFVCMDSVQDAEHALSKLQDAEINGRKLITNIAHAKSERSARTERPEFSRSSAPSRVGSNHQDSQDFDYMQMPPMSSDIPRRTHDDRKRQRMENDKARGVGRPKPKERRRSGRRRGGYADEFDDD